MSRGHVPTVSVRGWSLQNQVSAILDVNTLFLFGPQVALPWATPSSLTWRFWCNFICKFIVALGCFLFVFCYGVGEHRQQGCDRRKPRASLLLLCSVALGGVCSAPVAPACSPAKTVAYAVCLGEHLLLDGVSGSPPLSAADGAAGRGGSGTQEPQLGAFAHSAGDALGTGGQCHQPPLARGWGARGKHKDPPALWTKDLPASLCVTGGFWDCVGLSFLLTNTCF